MGGGGTSLGLGLVGDRRKQGKSDVWMIASQSGICSRAKPKVNSISAKANATSSQRACEDEAVLIEIALYHQTQEGHMPCQACTDRTGCGELRPLQTGHFIKQLHPENSKILLSQELGKASLRPLANLICGAVFHCPCNNKSSSCELGRNASGNQDRPCRATTFWDHIPPLHPAYICDK